MSFDLGSDPSAEFLDREPPHWVARGMSAVLLTVFVIALAAAAVVRLPETVTGHFVLTPLEGADPVRSRKDGVVAGIDRRQGDTVGLGQTLLLLRSASLSDRSADRQTLEAQARTDRERLTIAASQYQTRKRSDEAERTRLETRVRSLERVIASREHRAVLTRELADSALTGFRRGAVNRVEASSLDLEATTVAEELLTARSDLDDAQAALDRLAKDADARDLEYRELVRSLDESIETAGIRIRSMGHDLEDLTEAGLAIRSPCAGTVLRLYVSSPGALVREGEVLAEVACRGRRLQAEFPVPQSGVPLVRAGQPAKLRYDAFPYQRFGVRFGTVRWIGSAGVAGSVRDSMGFRAIVDLQDTVVAVGGRPEALLAGMEGRVDVIVGNRSLMAYALEPIRALQENLRVRPDP